MLSVIGVAACVEDPVATGDTYTRIGSAMAAAAGDTVPCPRNRVGFKNCRVLGQYSPEMSVLRQELSKFAPAQACQEAGESMRETLDNAPVYVALGETQYTGLVGFDRQDPPPHEPAFLILAEYIFNPAHVEAGNLREVMYHESGHLTGYEDEEPPESDRMTAEEFATQCKESEDGSVDTFHQTGGDGGDKGEPKTCVIRTWFWVSSGDVILTEVLYCY
jgi:hypothetical protein